MTRWRCLICPNFPWRTAHDPGPRAIDHYILNHRQER